MHPDITKFWEKRGLEIRSYKTIDPKKNTSLEYWFIVSDPDYYNQGGPPPPKNDDTICIKFVLTDAEVLRYYFQGKGYSELEMLKIAVLKAFI